MEAQSMHNTLCHNCGYSLAGLLDDRRRGTCPECGQKHKPRRRVDPAQLALRWKVPLGIALAAIGCVVFLTIMASVGNKTGMGNPDDIPANILLIMPSSALLWVATWITWTSTDPGAMRMQPWRTVVTGALVGIGAAVLTMILQVVLILATMMIVSAIKSSGA